MTREVWYAIKQKKKKKNQIDINQSACIMVEESDS